MAVREALAPFTGHPFDFEIWVRLGFYVSHGFDPYIFLESVQGLSFQNTNLLPSIAYPPAWALIQAFLYRVYEFTSIHNRFFYYFILKQPMVFGDLFVAAELYFILKRYNQLYARRAFYFWMLSPYTIILSSMWGMFDQLALALILASMIEINNIVKSSTIFSLSVFLKGLPIIFLVPFSFYNRSKRSALLYIGISVSLFILFTLLPYAIFTDWNISGLLASGTDTIHKVGNAMNYWVIFSSVAMYYTIPSYVYSFLRMIAYGWIPALLVAYTFYVKNKKDTMSYLIFSLLFVVLVFFLTAAQVNEQYITYFIAFGLIDLSINGAKRAKLFNGVWVSSTLYMFFNNMYLLRFFAPVFVQERAFEQILVSGLFGLIRTSLLITSALSFTYFSIRYLVSCYRRIKGIEVNT
jgi:hypothetical protein